MIPGLSAHSHPEAIATSDIVARAHDERWRRSRTELARLVSGRTAQAAVVARVLSDAEILSTRALDGARTITSAERRQEREFAIDTLHLEIRRLAARASERIDQVATRGELQVAEVIEQRLPAFPRREDGSTDHERGCALVKRSAAADAHRITRIVDATCEDIATVAHDLDRRTTPLLDDLGRMSRGEA